MALLSKQAKKAVIYCRVSTKEQVEEGNSLVTQEKNCREYAIKHGYEIVASFIEKGESAKTADRTELKKLMNFCTSKKNGVSIIIAYKLDRISRNTEDYSYMKVKLREHGVQIKSTTEHFDNTPAGKFMENIISNVSQFDNDVRAERCSDGMKTAVREGRYVWKAPYGYSNVRQNGKATIAQNDYAKFVRKAYELVAKNEYPSSVIREQLIKEGMTSHGKPISKPYFYMILRNEIYTGIIAKFGEKHRGNFEQIISEELFQHVQHLLNKKKHIKIPFLKYNPDFPLRKFFVHPSGKLLTGAWSTGRYKKYPYYFFHKTNVNIRKEVLEAVFVSWLNQFKLGIDYVEELEKSIKSHTMDEITKVTFTKHKVEQEIVSLKEKENLIIEKNLSGVLPDEWTKDKLTGIKSKIYTLQQQLLSQKQVKISVPQLFDITKQVLLAPGDAWKEADSNSKIALQWFYFPHGIILQKNESRTTKICKLFKLESKFLTSLSALVNHSNSKSNTQSWQTLQLPPIEEINLNTPESFEEIKEGLTALATIFKPELFTEEQDLLGKAA